MRFNFRDSVLRYPDMEGGGGDGPEFENDTGSIDHDVDHASGGDPDRGAPREPEKALSVRDQIKNSIEESREPPKPKKDRGGRFGDRQTQAQEPAAPVAPPAPPPAPSLPAPERLSKEAKAEWEKAPRAIQEAFVKAEQDMQRGVDELKSRYSLIDQAIAPHADAMRQMNATPGEAVNRMFMWFKALAGNPVASFPELAKSMGMDFSKIVQAVNGAQQQQPQPGQQQGAPQIPEPVRQYVGTLENQVRQLTEMVNQVQSGFGNIQSNIEAQNQAKTNENLSIWAKGKEYYEEVRQDMARLIQADPALVKNGQVDLDTAYERAIYYNPEVRAKVLAAQQQANQAVQQQATQAATTARVDQAAKARRAAVSLPSTNAPTTGTKAPTKPKGRQSVRDSLLSAISEVRDQQ